MREHDFLQGCDVHHDGEEPHDLELVGPRAQGLGQKLSHKQNGRHTDNDCDVRWADGVQEQGQGARDSAHPALANT